MRAWGIKLGSAGICVPFCEERGIVGLGWHDVRPDILATGSRDDLRRHVFETYPEYKLRRRAGGAAVRQLWTFARECATADYVLYYDPPRKRVQITRVTAEPLAFRESDGDDTDVWHYRRVERVATIPVLDFYAGLKPSLLIPRGSFWQIRDVEVVDQIARGLDPSVTAAADPEIQSTFGSLRDLVLRRAEALDDSDWERVVADYFRAQGAVVDEAAVGGNRPVIDIEARFDHGDLPPAVWRIQVKRHRNQVDWQTIQNLLAHAGQTELCFVSVYGFTDEAHAKARDHEMLLLEARHFVPFLLSGRAREAIRRKLKIPTL